MGDFVRCTNHILLLKWEVVSVHKKLKRLFNLIKISISLSNYYNDYKY